MFGVCATAATPVTRVTGCIDNIPNTDSDNQPQTDSDNQHTPSARYVPGADAGTRHVVAHLVLATAPWGEHRWCPRLPDDVAERRGRHAAAPGPSEDGGRAGRTPLPADALLRVQIPDPVCSAGFAGREELPFPRYAFLDVRVFYNSRALCNLEKGRFY